MARAPLALLLAPVLAAAVPAAAEGRVPATDDSVARLAGGLLLFDTAVEEPVIADPRVSSEFSRIGLRSACSVYNRGLAEVRERWGPEFTRILVAAVRAHVPSSVLDARTNFGWDSGMMMAYRRRILTDVEREGAGIFASARDDLLARMLVGAAVEPEEGRDRVVTGFEDWDLEKPLARKIACHLLGGPPDHFAPLKRAFDGFFTRGETH